MLILGFTVMTGLEEQGLPHLPPLPLAAHLSLRPALNHCPSRLHIPPCPPPSPPCRPLPPHIPLHHCPPQYLCSHQPLLQGHHITRHCPLQCLYQLLLQECMVWTPPNPWRGLDPYHLLRQWDSLDNGSYLTSNISCILSGVCLLLIVSVLINGGDHVE